MDLRRVARVLSGLWAGQVLAVGFLVAPAAFGVLERAQAGRLTGRLFELDAHLSLVMAVLLLMMERRRSRQADDAPAGSAMSANVILLLAALFCTVAGHYGLQPWMEQARAGTAPLSFAALHGIAAVIFTVKAALAATLAWRHAGPAPGSARG